MQALCLPLSKGKDAENYLCFPYGPSGLVTGDAGACQFLGALGRDSCETRSFLRFNPAVNAAIKDIVG
jgi:hypothetical protein